MGIYSKNGFAGNDDLSVNLEEYDEIQCNSEYFAEAAMNIVVEGEDNYNRIIQAIGIDEYCYFEENGVEMVYEAGNISSMFQKFKQFFINLWQKIKGLIKKFISLFDSYTKSDKDFVNKYRRHLLSVNMKNFEYKGYEFSDSKLNSFDVDKDAFAKATGAVSGYKSEGFSDKAQTVCDDFISGVSNSSDIEDKMRGAILKGLGSSMSTADGSEYTKELFILFRNNEDSKSTLTNLSISDQLGYILNTKDAIKNAKKEETSFNKRIKDVIKNLNTMEKKLVNETPNTSDDAQTKLQSAQIQACSKTISFTRTASNLATTALGAYLTALKDRNRQAKSICVAAMNYKPKNESTDLGGYNESGSLLDNVVLR